MRRALVLFALALAVLATTLVQAPARAAGVAGAQFRYWDFSDDESMRDVLAYYAPGRFHVLLEYWDFEYGEDQFRPEVGVHWRDDRRSAYTLQWRHEKHEERFWFQTDQVVGKGWVARASVSPIVTDTDVLTVVEAGADFYFQSWSFASVTVIRDPREDGLWVVPVRARLATEKNDWLQLTLAPASQKSIGWAADAKLGIARFGVERNSRYDFTSRDNLIFTAGVEFPLPARR